MYVTEAEEINREDGENKEKVQREKGAAEGPEDREGNH